MVCVGLELQGRSCRGDPGPSGQAPRSLLLVGTAGPARSTPSRRGTCPAQEPPAQPRAAGTAVLPQRPGAAQAFLLRLRLPCCLRDLALALAVGNAVEAPRLLLGLGKSQRCPCPPAQAHSELTLAG